jgi:uncharacterized protein YoxC
MPTIDYILIAIAVILGVAVLVQVIVLTAAGVSALKTMKAAREMGDELRPLMHEAKDLMQTAGQIIKRIEPKLDSAATDLAEIARTAREETDRISASAEEINQRIRRQAERMDNMTTSALNGVEQAGHLLNVTVGMPARQVSGVVAAARAIVSVLLAPRPSRRRAAPQGEPVAEPHNESRRYAPER